MENTKMIKMKSSNISACGYSPKYKTMVVEFKGGGAYSFPGVTLSAFEDFRDAESPGRHFFKNIRGKYDSSRIEEKE